MNLSPKKILSVSFGLFVFLFFATLVLSIFLNDPSNPIIDWVLGFAVALVFFWGVYIPFLSIRWVYRRLFPKSPKPVKNPRNSETDLENFCDHFLGFLRKDFKRTVLEGYWELGDHFGVAIHSVFSVLFFGVEIFQYPRKICQIST